MSMINDDQSDSKMDMDNKGLHEKNFIEQILQKINEIVNNATVHTAKQTNDINSIIKQTGLYEQKDIDKIIKYINQQLEKIKEINLETEDDQIKKIDRQFDSIWSDYNYFFTKCSKEYKKRILSENSYNLVKKNRGLIYTKACNFKAKKQSLKKEKFVQEQRNKFQKLTGKEKFWRVFLLVIAFPIYAPIFILIKTIRKFVYCLVMGLEVIGTFLYGEKGQYRDCKDDWAEYCEKGYLDGIKINGEEVCKRIRWYETSRWLFWRRVFFPINLAVFIVIGVVLAAFKLIKSIVKIFVIVYRIIKDILSDNPCAHMFKKEGPFMYNDSKFLSLSQSHRKPTHELVSINLEPIAVAANKNIKIKNKFIDMTSPRIPCYDFAKTPKSALDHFKCLTGFKSIKSAKYWDEYEHIQCFEDEMFN